MNPKRIRSVNWDEEEKQLLRSVLKDYAHIIEDKSLNTNTNKNKTKAWDEVYKKFNELNCRQRELGQLKIQWKGMKVNARKTYSTFKKETNKTGGGARPATPDDFVIEVKDLLNPAELLRDNNPFDSDGLQLKPTTYEVKGPAMDIVSFDKVSQGYEQDSNILTVEEVDILVDTQKTPLGGSNVITIEEIDIHVDAQKTSLGNSEDDINIATPLQTNMSKITEKKVPKRKLNFRKLTERPDSVSKSSKDHDYVSNMLSHSRSLKDEEHRRRMEMAEEEHNINMRIKQEKLKCVILEKEILELRKAREKND